MKTFVCLLLAVASCKAGYEGKYTNEVAGGDTGHEGNAGYDYTPQLSGGDYSGHLGQGLGAFGGQAHGLAFSGLGGHDLSGGQTHTLALTQGHDFGGAQDYGAPSFDGHTQHFVSQDDGNSHSAQGADLSGDSYLQAAQDSHNQGNEGHQIDEGHQFGGHGFGPDAFTLEDAGNEYGQGDEGHGIAEAIPVGEHVDEEHPVRVPVYKHVTYPIPKTVHINVPKPILVGVPQPYPVKVPVNKPVAVPVETEINIPIEKVVPYPVVKHVPYPVEKHVPIKVEKTVTVHVPQPYPVKIPVYKIIHHHHKGH